MVKRRREIPVDFVCSMIDLSDFSVVAIPIEFGDASHQNRSLEDEQLDDGIVDTLVSALLLMSACHKGCRVSSQANE